MRTASKSFAIWGIKAPTRARSPFVKQLLLQFEPYSNTRFSQRHTHTRTEHRIYRVHRHSNKTHERRRKSWQNALPEDGRIPLPHGDVIGTSGKIHAADWQPCREKAKQSQ